MAPLNQEFEFLRKTGRPASFGASHGRFPFFTSSQEISKRTDVSDCVGPALVFGTGGSASVHYVEGPFSATNDCYVVVPKSGRRDDAKFFHHYLRSNIHLIEIGFRGAGLKHVSKKHLQEIELPTDKRIDRGRVATILDKSDAICSRRRQMLSLVESLIKSAFIETFGEPFSNPKNIRLVPIKQLGRVVTGNTPPRSNPNNYGEGIEWIKSDNINTPHHFLTTAKERLSPMGESIARKVPPRSVLVTCIAGSPDCIGNAAITDREVAFNQQINAIVPSRDTNPFFLYVQTLIAKKLIQAASTNSMKGMVSKGKFQEINFLAPDSEDQYHFGINFQFLLRTTERLRSALQQEEDFYASLSQRAFRGEL